MEAPQAVKLLLCWMMCHVLLEGQWAVDKKPRRIYWDRIKMPLLSVLIKILRLMAHVMPEIKQLLWGPGQSISG